MRLFPRGGKGGIYYADLGRMPGERRLVSLHTYDYDEAKKAYDELVAQRLRKRLGLPEIEKPKPPQIVPTFAEVAPIYSDHLERTRRPNTTKLAKRVLRTVLVPRFGALRLDEINAIRIEELIAARRRQGVLASTVNRDLDILRRVLRFAVQSGRLAQMPAHVPQLKRDRPSIARVVQEAELDAILACASLRMKAAILLGRECGLRISEARCLPLRHVDLKAGSVFIDRDRGSDFEPKGGVARGVPLTAEALAALKAWLVERPNRGPYLFPGQHEGVRPLSESRLRDDWGEAIRKAGVRCRYHDLRHTLATRLVQADVHPRKILATMGWRSMAMLATYEHLADDDLRQGIEAASAAKRRKPSR